MKKHYDSNIDLDCIVLWHNIRIGRVYFDQLHPYWIRRLRRFLEASILALCLPLLPLAPVVFTGCQQYGAISTQNTDQIILRAEQTAQTARLTFDTFVRLERDNEATLKQINPAIHTYANYIRTHGLDWVTSLREATKTFKANRTPENQASLNTLLATITNAVSQSNKYIAQARAAHI